MLKKHMISYLYLFGLIIGLTIIASFINYFLLFDISILKIIIPIISLFISSFILGCKVKKRGYIEGIKFGLFFIIFICFIKIIENSSFNLKVIILFILFLMSSSIGAMIGVNKKIKNN